MKNKILKIARVTLCFAISQAHAAICPDPNTSSLQWGEIPAPWELSPFSENRPQGEVGTTFARANILVAGFGRGILCNYHNSVGYYSIWWQVNVKVPSRMDNTWRDSLAGFECTAPSVDACVFYPA